MAKTIYCVRKDPLGPKTEDNWIQMDAKAFKEFRKTKEARNRYFIRMGDDCHEGCDTIIIDVDKEQYDEWRREYDRHRYLARQERNS